MRFTSVVTVAALIVVVTGCATTGDPTQGGLFGWSEEKAKQRQEELRREAKATENEAFEERQMTIALSSELDDERATLESLERQLARLVTENEVLTNKLAELHATRSVRSVKYQELRAELQELTLASDPQKQFLDLRNVDDKRTYVERVRKANEATAEAIKLLLSN